MADEHGRHSTFLIGRGTSPERSARVGATESENLHPIAKRELVKRCGRGAVPTRPRVAWSCDARVASEVAARSRNRWSAGCSYRCDVCHDETICSASRWRLCNAPW